MAYGQPTVAGGRLFVGSADGTVYALDADTGCLYWTFKAGAPVRTAISVGAGRRVGGLSSAIWRVTRTPSMPRPARLCGRRRWMRTGREITGAPTLADGRLYVPASSTEEGLAADRKYACCTFRGSLSALDAATGAVIWKIVHHSRGTEAHAQEPMGVQLTGPSGAAVWSSPTVDLERGMVFVTTGDSYSDPAAATSDAFVAFDLKTGKLLWSRQMTAGDAFTVDCDFPEEMRANCPDGERARTTTSARRRCW